MHIMRRRIVVRATIVACMAIAAITRIMGITPRGMRRALIAMIGMIVRIIPVAMAAGVANP